MSVVDIARGYSREPTPFDRDCISVSDSMCQVVELARRLAVSEARTILLQGETGVGKDVVANAVHQCSPRRGKRFVAVNCAAIPDTLFESELFGHERGAFTDARSCKAGLLEISDQGTLFLDEIGQIPHRLQGKLLRVLEEGSFRRLGGVSDNKMDIRFVAASNIDLGEAARQGAFRMDLLFRLNVFQINIPPLRDRREDILPLAEHFVQGYNRSYRREIQGISNQAADALIAHSWPGNVRQLRNVVERAMVMEESSRIELASLAPDVGHFHPAPTRSELPEEDLTLTGSEHRLLIRALERSCGNQTRAAVMLGISRDTLRYKIRKHGLSLPV